MIDKVLRLAGAAAIVWCGAGDAVAAAINVDPLYPLRGQVARVQVVDEQQQPIEGAVIQVQYRPNSATSFTDSLLPTDQDGFADWTARDAGIVTLRAYDGAVGGPSLGTLDVAVRYGAFPMRGILVMLIAGVFLFGGAALGFTFLIRERKVPEHEPPIV